MRRFSEVAVLVVGGGIVALVARTADAGGEWTAFALIGGWIAAGELIELRPPGRTGLPISFAFMVVLAERTAPSVADAALVLLVALLASFLVRSEPVRFGGRVALILERFVEGLACVIVYNAVLSAFDNATRVTQLTALAAASLAPIVVAEFAHSLRERRISLTTDGRSADLALVTSAVLMAVSDRGVGAAGGMGLWGPVIFAIPLLAAWYSYEQLDTIRVTYDQTIRALGAAPELGGIVLEGHAERVAALAVGAARELGFSRQELDHLETAALLHHLGQVCLDEPEADRTPDPVAIAEAGAEILQRAPLLAPAGDVLAAEALTFWGQAGSRPSVMAGQVLKAVSAFDELAHGDPDRVAAALEVLYSAPAYVYDAHVLRALEIALDRAGLLPPVTV